MSLLNLLRGKLRHSAAPRGGAGRGPCRNHQRRPLAIEPLEDRRLLSYSFRMIADVTDWDLLFTPSINSEGTLAYAVGPAGRISAIYTSSRGQILNADDPESPFTVFCQCP